jgi:hypothetical protein
MLEAIGKWSNTRLFWTLVLSYVFFAEAVSWITSQTSLCIVDAESYGEYYSEHRECPKPHVVLIKSLASVFEAVGHEWLLAIATTVIAGFTATLWWSTRGLLFATSETIKLARDEFLSTHRPKIRIKSVFLMNEMIVHGEPLIIHVVCVNSGVSSATIVDFGIESFIVWKDRSLPADKRLEMVRVHFVLDSGISVPLPDYEHRITNDEEVRLRRGETNLYCLGCVHYRDDAKRLRTTHFCRVLTFDPLSGASGGHFAPTNNPDYEYQD